MMPNGRQMNLFRIINFVLVAALGTTAGIPKMMRMPHEVEAFANTGLGTRYVIGFVIVLLIGGILLVIPATRFWGAILTSIMFLASAVMLFITGKITFGCVSLIPVLMAAFIVYDLAQNRPEITP